MTRYSSFVGPLMIPLMVLAALPRAEAQDCNHGHGRHQEHMAAGGGHHEAETVHEPVGHEPAGEEGEALRTRLETMDARLARLLDRMRSAAGGLEPALTVDIVRELTEQRGELRLIVESMRGESRSRAVTEETGNAGHVH